MQRTATRILAMATALLAVAALAIGGCGFQPRGQAPSLSGVPGPMYVSGIPPHSGLSRELTRQLELAGVDIVASVPESAAVLRIGRRSSDSRMLSVDSRNKAVEYELEESAQFSLRAAGGRELVAEQTVRVVRILFRPGDAVLASDREAELLREDMRKELAGRIVRRLAAR
jgi:LPS-assembly lipoprotein